MPISVTAFANPVQELIEILPNVAGALSIANSAINKADIIDAEIVNDIRPKANRIPDLEIKANSLQNGLDDSLNLIFKNADELADNKILINAAQDSIARADDAINLIDNKATRALGNAADLFDRVANIFSLIATLATAARMEFIAADLNSKINIINQALNEIYESIGNINATNADQQNAINDLYGQIDMIAGQLNSILNAITAQSQYLIPTYNNSFQALYKLDALTGIASSIKSDTGVIIGNQSAIQSAIGSGFGGIPSQLCQALNSGCFDWENIGADCDLSPVLSAMNALQQGVNNISSAVGGGAGYCGDESAFGNLTQGLQSLVCSGGGGFNFQEALEDYFANNQAVDLQPVIDKVESKGEEVIAAIEEIEVVAAIPDQWQVRVGADRPQLIVSYAETLTGGKIGRSRYPLTIPHWNGLKKWDLLPKWTKGNTQARLILKDNSRVYVYASSESMAIATMNKVIKFIDPSMIGNKTPFVGKANISIKPLKVEPCTAKFYAKGQKTEIPDFYQIRIKPKTT